MTTHITLRLAWHNDGWNGRICAKPAENSYCVGCSSYPGEVIHERRDLEWEKKKAWYEKHFLSRFLVTEESKALSNDAAEVIAANFA